MLSRNHDTIDLTTLHKTSKTWNVLQMGLFEPTAFNRLEPTAAGSAQPLFPLDNIFYRSEQLVLSMMLLAALDYAVDAVAARPAFSAEPLHKW